MILKFTNIHIFSNQSTQNFRVSEDSKRLINKRDILNRFKTRKERFQYYRNLDEYKERYPVAEKLKELLYRC